MEIFSLQKEHTEYISQVAEQFEKYYKSMEDKGLILKIVPNGGKIWMNSILLSLDKFQKIIIAVENERVAGFTRGYIHLAPPFVGKFMIGVWDGLYIESEFRGLGLSKQLYLELEQWFREKRVHSIEGQVLHEHFHSIQGCLNMGFSKELFQLRKVLYY